METSLHRALKERHGPGSGTRGRVEVAVGGYRVDAVADDGEIVEVQSGALGPLRGKLRSLLPTGRVRVVKPVVLSRRVVRRARREGPDLSARLSPRKGALVDVFDDLIGLARVFPHPNLVVELVGVEIDEVRVVRRRRPGYAVVDRCLRSVIERRRLAGADDLWSLLPEGLGADGPFTTRELAERLGRSRDFAQRVAYCLRLTGAAETLGKRGNSLIYARSDAATTALGGSATRA